LNLFWNFLEQTYRCVRAEGTTNDVNELFKKKIVAVYNNNQFFTEKQKLLMMKWIQTLNGESPAPVAAAAPSTHISTEIITLYQLVSAIPEGIQRV
jgi:hypothetical protein